MLFFIFDLFGWQSTGIFHPSRGLAMLKARHCAVLPEVLSQNFAYL